MNAWRPPQGVLAELVEGARQDLALRRRERPGLSGEARRLPARSPRFRSALETSAGALPLICEVKRASPSAGAIRTGDSAPDRARAYARGGARCISVLTEGRRFGGSLDDLARVRAAVDLPLLRKDFVVDLDMVAEAALAGADAVLLLAGAVPPAALAELNASARELGMDVLLEVVHEWELEAAEALDAMLVGVNARDLETLAVDPNRFATLAPRLVRKGRLLVAESGIRSAADLYNLAAAGADAALVGEALMRAHDPEQAVRALAEVPCPSR